MRRSLFLLSLIIGVNSPILAQEFSVPELRKLALMTYSQVETNLFNKGIKYKSSSTKSRDDGSKSFYKISEFSNSDQSILMRRQEIKTFGQNAYGVVSKVPEFEYSINYYFTEQEYLEKYKLYLRQNKFEEILDYNSKDGEHHIDYRPEIEESGKIFLYSVTLIRRPEGSYPRYGISVAIGTK